MHDDALGLLGTPRTPGPSGAWGGGNDGSPSGTGFSVNVMAFGSLWLRRLLDLTWAASAGSPERHDDHGDVCGRVPPHHSSIMKSL